MSRHVIIDGYNLLGVQTDTKSEQPSEGAETREMLIRRLSGYSQGKGYAVTVVFDAWRGLQSLEHRNTEPAWRWCIPKGENVPIR